MKSIRTKPENVSNSIVHRMWCMKLLLRCLRGLLPVLLLKALLLDHSFAFIYAAHFKKKLKQMGKIKSFSDSQPGECSKHVLKIWANLSLNVLIKKRVYSTMVTSLESKLSNGLDGSEKT